MVARLGAIAPSGDNHKLASRQLHTLLGRCGIDLPIVENRDSELVSHYISPIRLLDLLRVKYPARFVELAGIDRGKLARFWDSLLASPHGLQVRANPALAGLSDEALRRIIPLCIHEDSGPFTKTKSVDILSFSGLFGSAGEKCSQYPIASFVKEAPLSDVESQHVWAPILKECEELASKGVGGQRFLLLFVKGDLDVRSNTWGFASWNSHEPCSECCCDRAGRPYTDLVSSAAWRRAGVLTSAQYYARARQPLHPLLASSFAWRFFAPLDLMHLADCHGLVNHVAGSVIGPLVSNERRLGANRAARLKSINDLLRAFYAARPNYNRMPELRMPNLTDSGGWYNLCGKTVKAANCRALAPFLVELAEAFYDSGTEYDRMVVRMVRSLDQFYSLLYTYDIVLSREQQSTFRRTLLRLGSTYQRLRELSVVMHRQAWNIVFKIHYLQHLPELASICNPTAVQNYQDEGHVGTMTRLWGKCAVGNYKGVIQKHVLVRRLVGLFIRLGE